MVPRIGQQGSSFLGAGRYYLHDKGADTDRRVALTHTENLPTDDPDAALRWMAYTAMDAERLKREAGVRRGGTPCERPVLGISLSWHPEQEPEHEHMIWAMNDALKAIGLEHHQRLMVIHNDEPQAHIHAINNLVHPDHGRVASLKFSKEKLAKWAEEYERTYDRKIYCHARVAANERREQEQAKRKKEREAGVAHEPGSATYPRHKEEALKLKAEITRLYHESKDGQEFRAAVERLGYCIAQGGRIVLVESATGKIHSIARQIEGAKPKDIRAKLAGIELPSVDDVRARQAEQTRAQAENQRRQETTRQEAQAGRSGDQSGESGSPAPQPGSVKKPQPQKARIVTPRMINELLDRHIEQMAAFHDNASTRRASFGATLEQQYGENARALRQDIARLQSDLDNAGFFKTMVRKLTGKLPKMQKSLEDKRRSLENIETRQSEAWGGFEAKVKAQEVVIRRRQQQERENLATAPPSPANQNRPRGQFERAAEANAETTHSPAPSRQSSPTRER